MATLAENVTALATRIGQECKTLHDEIGTLSSLTTEEKSNLVGAVNEVSSAAASHPMIDDENKSTKNTYSSNKIEDFVTTTVQTAKDELLNGAGTAYDTLKELGDLIDVNKDAIEALSTLAAGHVVFDKAQTLTEAQKTQARENIGAASATELSEYQDAIGDTDINLSDIFNNALSGTTPPAGS